MVKNSKGRKQEAKKDGRVKRSDIVEQIPIKYN